MCGQERLTESHKSDAKKSYDVWDSAQLECGSLNDGVPPEGGSDVTNDSIELL